jgi:hypothetical protein
VHTIAGASRETRKQADVNVRRGYDDSAYNVNGGVSSEPDYLSRFAGVGGQWDFNQKLTTLNAGLAYTWSDIKATLDHDATPYIYNACGTARCNFVSSSSHIADTGDGGKVMYGKRHDWAATAGVTQVLSRNAQLQGERGLYEQPWIPIESIQARRGRVHRSLRSNSCRLRRTRCTSTSARSSRSGRTFASNGSSTYAMPNTSSRPTRGCTSTTRTSATTGASAPIRSSSSGRSHWKTAGCSRPWRVITHKRRRASMCRIW